jgi:dTDP-4-dehydrorhamnose reductase
VRLFTDERRCPIWVESLAAALLELSRSEDVGPSLPPGLLHVAGAQPLSRYQFGLRLARFHRVDPRAIAPALSSDSGLIRPLDCTLDCTRARALLHTPLPGVDEVLCRGEGGDR